MNSDHDVKVVCGNPGDLDGVIEHCRAHGMTIAAEVYEEVRDGKIEPEEAQGVIFMREANDGVGLIYDDNDPALWTGPSPGFG